MLCVMMKDDSNEAVNMLFNFLSIFFFLSCGNDHLNFQYFTLSFEKEKYRYAANSGKEV